MGKQPERLLNRIRRAYFQFRKIIIHIVRLRTIVITVIAGTAFPLLTFAANCTLCGDEVDSDDICYNSLCPNSAIHCVNHQTGAQVYVAPALLASYLNNINLCADAAETAGQSDVAEQGDRQAPPWLLNINRDVTRNEQSQPNLHEYISQSNIDNPQYAFRNVNTAKTTIQSLLRIRNQHFIVSYYFSIVEQEYAMHLAVAVDHEGTIFALSNIAADWRTITKVDSDDIMSLLGLSDASFEPPEERMIVNHVAKKLSGKPCKPRQPYTPPKRLEVIMEEDESLTE